MTKSANRLPGLDIINRIIIVLYINVSASNVKCA